MVRINLRHAVCIRRQNVFGVLPLHRHTRQHPLGYHCIVLHFAHDTLLLFQPQKIRFECRFETVYHLRA